MRKETQVEGDRSTRTIERRPIRERLTVISARGGVSLWSVLTGVLVAFGAMLIFSAIIGGILAETGVDAAEVAREGPTDAGLGIGIGMIGAMLLAYLWGGYTAGRMGRGAGLLNGLLVPIVAILIGVIVAAILNAANVDANLNLPFTEGRLATDEGTLYDWGQTIGVGMLIAMFVGGIVGGLAGHGWHRKLERQTLAEREAEVAEKESVVARDEAVRTRDATATREPARERVSTVPERGGAAAQPATTRPVHLPEDESTTRK